MTRKKPVAMLVFGIINLVVGSLGAVACVCAGGVFLLMYAGFRSAFQQAAGPEQELLNDMGTAFSKNLPGLVPFMTAYTVIGIVLSVVQIVSGVGLVAIRNWGRWLCAIWAVLIV